MSDPDWRPILAALANPDTRGVFADLVLGADEPGSSLGPSRRRHALDRLRAAGVVDDDGMLDPSVFARVLAAVPKREKATGVERFLTPEGRIDRYPSNAAERHAMLQLIAHRAVEPGEVLAERALTERLAGFADDAVALRRHLVDAGLVERTRSGSEYALARTP